MQKRSFSSYRSPFTSWELWSVRPCSHDTSLAADCQQRNQDFLLWYNGFSDKTTKPTEGETLSVLGKNKKSLKPKFQDFLVRTTGLEPVTSCV